MTAERWTRTVRHQLGLGRLLPLGGPRDGTWISEEAAEAVLRRAAVELRGVRLDGLRMALADPEDVQEPAVPPPPSALPPGALRVTAQFAATATAPLPATAALVRTTLAAAADERLGLRVTEVDLQVTALLDEDPEPAPVREPEPPYAAAEPGSDDESRAASAALSVVGVAHLTGGLGRAVQLEERQAEGALPHRHARVELAVEPGHRPSDVARQVRTAVRDALPDRPTVAVLVTAVG
ncbi:nucleopolyhedrovirus P10 family protein [Streptomyces spinosirectus]|uniref:nucleopolyhedrovirus P10 family protein n=1 Tax=Streptomyces TaxID=1883 RepID=UPI001C9DA41F|nr:MULTISPECIES: nucleopolyhedrovirus P10 family protein [Streptomyces]MBY8342245.1 nucleopolyhedrovirus P10 family protein [Streptomyces plumbidurans]UIR17247.1 nucleopolyhedrovirus P10 family protein [Streptomyces spinosirectus]